MTELLLQEKESVTVNSVTKVISWTPSLIEGVKNLLLEGYSFDDVALRLGTSKNNLKLQLFKRGITLASLGITSAKEKNSIQRLQNKHKLSISERIMELLGLELEDSILPKTFTDEQLKNWLEGKEGVVLFVKEALDISLQDFQVDMIEVMLNNRHCCFLMGRRAGKSYTCGLFALYKALLQPNQHILLVSPTQDSSLNLFRIILGFVAKSQEIRWSIRRDTADTLEFKNNSIIRSLSAQSLALRGLENTAVILDEVSSLENPESVMSALTPSLASRTNSQLILISTPRAKQGLLWDAWQNQLYAKRHYPSTINKHVDNSWIELEKQNLPAEIFRMEYLAEWCEDVDVFFKTEVIERCVQNYSLTSFPEPGTKYWAGVDWGAKHDASLITIVGKGADGVLKVCNIIEMINVPFSVQLQRLGHLHASYQFQLVCVEEAGLSIPLVQELAQDNSMRLLRFIPTLKNKEEIYLHLLKKMENLELILPKHPKLIYQLKMFQYVVTPSGMKLHHAGQGHDDFPDSLAFALWAAKIGLQKPCFRVFGAKRY